MAKLNVAAEHDKLVVKLKRTGRVRPPNLADPQLKEIGDKMVLAQKLRWEHGITANGTVAKKLSVKYAIIKQSYIHKRPIRDMKITGQLLKNFQLRKAAAGTIRAENTSKLQRDKASRCQNYEEMIGFASTDQRMVFDESVKAYGKYLTKAWVQIG